MTFEQLKNFVFKEMPEWSLTVTWANGDPALSVAVSGSLKPPRRYNMRGLFFLADSEKEWVMSVLAGLPGILNETSEHDDRIAQMNLAAAQADLVKQGNLDTHLRRVRAVAVRGDEDSPKTPGKPRRVVNRAHPKRGGRVSKKVTAK